MSCDTDFKLTFTAPSQADLEDVMSYLNRKTARWSAWKQRGKDAKDLLRRVGAKNYGAVVSWGFEFGELQEDGVGNAFVEATTWANQNVTNVHVTGEKGELEDLLDKFPSLDISGTYKDEYGGSGNICGFEQC